MLRKNTKKSRSSKKCEPPSKIKLRKHLNADALFMSIRHEFEKIPEFRTGDIEISIPDALMSAFAMFSLKISSLLKFDERKKDETECQNLKSVYGIKNIPSDSRMREICDEIDQKNIYLQYLKLFFGMFSVARIWNQWFFIKDATF